jgi:hypothetical protein
MAYLELSPLISALRDRPADFEIDRGWLTHFPSRHSFKFDREGSVRLHARCDCSRLLIHAEEGQELWTEYKVWREAYWRPIEINREFASHFHRPNVLQRILRRLLAKARRFLLDPALDEEPVNARADRSAAASA